MTEEELEADREARRIERKKALKKLEEENKKTDELYAKAFDKPEPSESEAASAQTEEIAAITASETKSESTAKKEDKTTEKPFPVKKRIIRPPKAKLDEQVVDYSHLYNSFYDIFVGFQQEPKVFDLNFCVRDTRNCYATFVNLIDSNALAMKNPHQFSANPLEKGYKDIY